MTGQYLRYFWQIFVYLVSVSFWEPLQCPQQSISVLQYAFCWKYQIQFFSSSISASCLTYHWKPDTSSWRLTVSQPAFLRGNNPNSSTLSESYAFWNVHHSFLSSGLYPFVLYRSWIAAPKSTLITSDELLALLSLAVSFCHAEDSCSHQRLVSGYSSPQTSYTFSPAKPTGRRKAFFPGTHLTCFTHCHFVIVTKGQAQNGPEELVHIPARNSDPVNTENTPKKADQLSARSHLKTSCGQG